VTKRLIQEALATVTMATTSEHLNIKLTDLNRETDSNGIVTGDSNVTPMSHAQPQTGHPDIIPIRKQGT
jgi:hypothetical protein